MKKISLIFTMFVFVFSIQAQTYRYTTQIFDNVDITTGVVYGNQPQVNSPNNNENNTTAFDLLMDIHQPQGDIETNRPAIIFAHGGAFVSGDRTVDDMKAFCDSFARMGYVTATIDYRMGMYALSSDFTPISGARAVYRGLQDGRAAIRFLRANASTYGIDPTKIYMAGNSAGSFIALQTIYMDTEAEKPTEAGIVTYSDPVIPYGNITTPDLGALDIGDNLTENGKPDAVFALWGGIKHTDLITAENNTPVYLIHGTADTYVPFGVGHPFGLTNLPETYGSNSINTKLNDLGLTNKFTYFVEGEEHEFYGVDNGNWENGTGGNAYWDTVVAKATNFFWLQHKPTANYTFSTNNLEVNFNDESTPSESWLWNFGDGSTSDFKNPTHNYTSAGTYDVSLYIENNNASWDTITKEVTVSSTSIYNNENKNISILPNPTNGIFVINSNGIEIKNIEIIDIAGKIIYSEKFKNSKIDLSEQAKGIYFVKIKTEKTYTTIKLIVD